MPKAKQKSIEAFAPETNRLHVGEEPRTNGYFTTHKRKIIYGLVALVLLAGIATGVKTFIDLQNTKKELEAVKNNPNEKAREENLKLVEQVGQLVVLPEGEEPTIATVTDPSKLADQPFFANARTGDKVLIYQTAARAILYRPADNKVIEIAPLTLGAGTDISSGAQPDSER